MSTAASPGPAGERPPLYFQVPEGFYDMPLEAASAQEWEQRVVELVEGIWPGATEFQRDMAADVYAGLAEDLAGAGVEYAGLAVVEMEGRLSMGTLSVAVREMANPEPGVTVESVAEMLSAADPDRLVDATSLPCGPAVVTAEGLQADVGSVTGEQEETAGNAGANVAGEAGEPEEAGEAEEPRSAYLVQLQTWVPFPSAPHMAVFTLSTPHPEDAGFYQQVMARITDTVTFTEPAWAAEATDPSSAET